MNTLIIPDVHEDVEALTKIKEEYVDHVDRVVCLGDWWDTFGEHNAKAMCGFILRYISDKRFTWLLGNHDCGYFFKHPYFQCSGYKKDTQELVDKLLPIDVRRQFKLWTEVGPFTVSHAGFHDYTLRYKTPEEHEIALDAAFSGGFHSLFMPGSVRGGLGIGGVTWQDWTYEFADIPKLPQIVGHTRRDGEVRRKGKSWCIDSGLRHVAVVSDGDVEIIEVLR